MEKVKVVWFRGVVYDFCSLLIFVVGLFVDVFDLDLSFN